MSSKQTISLFIYLSETKEVIVARRAKHQSLPGILQSTVHGAIEEGENALAALRRELYEETGLALDELHDLEVIGERRVGRRTTEHCAYYMAVLGATQAEHLEPNAEIKEFIRLKAVDLEHIITTDYAKEESIDPKDAYVMFEDERDYLAEVFDHLI